MNDVQQQVMQWLTDVVVGLNLCPFAAKPLKRGQIRLVEYGGSDEQALLDLLELELNTLKQTPVEEIETTLLITPKMFADFADYNQFLDPIDQHLRLFGWEGIIQVASFHPDYCFADTHPDDAENLTNRAPYPIFHLIREDSLARVLASFPDPDSIPVRNIKKMNALTPSQRKMLFPYLKN